jgi:putative addiction module killer protein
MVDVVRSDVFDSWLCRLRDPRAKARVLALVRRLSLGNSGDTRALGRGLLEMRIDYGPGYRIYYMHSGESLVLLLCGGDKRTQRADIILARRIAADWYR